jgi:hypothetical protein
MSDNELAEALNYFEAKRARKEALELLVLVRPEPFSIEQRVTDALLDPDATKGALENCKRYICVAVDERRKGFFILLGKLLDGKIKSPLQSKRDAELAFILCFHPSIKATDAVKLMAKLGHGMTEDYFRVTKQRWKRIANERRKAWEKLGWNYYGNSFLDYGKT